MSWQCFIAVALNIAAMKCFWVGFERETNSWRAFRENDCETKNWERAVMSGRYCELKVAICLGFLVDASITVRRRLYRPATQAAIRIAETAKAPIDNDPTITREALKKNAARGSLARSWSPRSAVGARRTRLKYVSACLIGRAPPRGLKILEAIRKRHQHAEHMYISLADHSLVHIYTIVEGNEEELNPPILTAYFEASEDNSFARSTTWGSRWHKPGEMIGSKVGGLGSQ